jgi:hypothetical protein
MYDQNAFEFQMAVTSLTLSKGQPIMKHLIICNSNSTYEDRVNAMNQSIAGAVIPIVQ